MDLYCAKGSYNPTIYDLSGIKEVFFYHSLVLVTTTVFTKLKDFMKYVFVKHRYPKQQRGPNRLKLHFTKS